jgi:copper chaperone NosL
MVNLVKFRHCGRFILMGVIGLCVVGQMAVLADGKGPVPARRPLTEDCRLQVSLQDRCPVCGMFPAKWPDDAAAMVVGDDLTYYFCSNGCLLRAFRHPAKYLGVDPKKVIRLVVKDYFTGKSLDANDAFWVAGSDALGPMGPALVALSSDQAMRTFMARHGGSLVFRLDKMDEELWQRILSTRK